MKTNQNHFRANLTYRSDKGCGTMLIDTSFSANKLPKLTPYDRQRGS